MLTALSIGRGGLGRMGNCMFTIAGVIGTACKSGQPFAFPQWKLYDNPGFGLPLDDMTEHFVNPLPLIPEGLTFQEYGYFWGYRDLKFPTGNYTIDAHMQSDKYFRDFMPMIRHYFTMKDEFSTVDGIALHYRAGDYHDDPNGYHPRCSKEYYLSALNLLPKDLKVSVFSDDIEAAMKILGDDDRFYYSRRDKGYIKDFKFMKAHKHFITANSSFSLMAAILGEHPDKKIVCPSRWFGPTVGLETADLYPENSTVI